MEPPTSAPAGMCSKCDEWIEHGTGKHEYLPFQNPIPAQDGLPEILGVWTSVHKACFEGDEITYAGKAGIA